MRVIRRSINSVFAGVLLTGAIVACTTGTPPGWTYAPVSPSVAPSGSAGPSAPASAPASGEPSAEPSGPASAEPSGTPSGGGLTLVAEGIAYDKRELQVAADEPFSIAFDNRDAGQIHDVDIRSADGTVIKDQEWITGPAQVTYEYEALAAGEYVFICQVHPVVAMTGTLTVQ
jgi:plastocyanin